MLSRPSSTRKSSSGLNPRPRTTLPDLAPPRPKLLCGQPGSFRHRSHLGPGDIRVYPPAVPTVGAGDHVFPTHDSGVSQDAIRHQLRRFNSGSFVGDDAGNEYLAIRELVFFPKFPIQLVACVRRFQGVRAGVDLQDQVDDMLEGQVTAGLRKT